MTEAAIQTTDLTRDFGSVRAVDHLTLDVPPGSSSASSVPMALARPPPFTCCSACSKPPLARPASSG